MKWDENTSESSEDSDSESVLKPTDLDSDSDSNTDSLAQLEKEYIDVSSPIGYLDAKLLHRKQ